MFGDDFVLAETCYGLAERTRTRRSIRYAAASVHLTTGSPVHLLLLVANV
jgi:hypothetical protein